MLPASTLRGTLLPGLINEMRNWNWTLAITNNLLWDFIFAEADKISKSYFTDLKVYFLSNISYLHHIIRENVWHGFLDLRNIKPYIAKRIQCRFIVSPIKPIFDEWFFVHLLVLYKLRTWHCFDSRTGRIFSGFLQNT